MNEEHTTTSDDPTDLDAARRDVARAEQRLSSCWRAAKAAGEKSLGKALSVAKPIAIGAAVIAGAVWMVSSLNRGRRRNRRAAGPPSLVSEMARAAALALVSAAARRLAERYLELPAGHAKLHAERALPKAAG